MKKKIPSPWLTAWFSPVQTVRNVLKAKKPLWGVIPMAFLMGFNSFLSRANIRHWGDYLPLWGILLLALIIAVPAGLLGIYIRAGVLRWTGEKFGGVGEPDEARVVVIWASIPFLVSFLTHLIRIGLMGEDSFRSLNPDTAGLNNLIGEGVTSIGAIVLMIWEFILLVWGLAEIHKFSKWKAAASILVWVVPVYLILSLLSRSFPG